MMLSIIIDIFLGLPGIIVVIAVSVAPGGYGTDSR